MQAANERDNDRLPDIIYVYLIPHVPAGCVEPKYYTFIYDNPDDILSSVKEIRLVGVYKLVGKKIVSCKVVMSDAEVAS